MAKKKKAVRKKRAPKRRGPSAKKEFASDSQYFKGSDVKKPFDAVVASLEKKDVGDESKWVMGFEDFEKQVVLNKTNGNALAADLGDNIDEWVGQLVHVFTERRRNPTTNQMVDAIAVCGASEDDDDLDDFDDDDELE